MKFAFFWLFFINWSLTFAQLDFKNSVKFNVIGPASRLYSVQYERKVSEHWAFNNTVFYRQKSLIPFGVQIDTLAKRHGLNTIGIKFQHVFMNEARMGVFGYSPELRYYFGQNKNRFFVSAYGQYENFDMNVPISLAVKVRGLFLNDVKTPIDFNFQTLSGGLLIGKQIKWKRFGLDIVIFGPHVGKARKFNALNTSELFSELSADDRQYLRDKIVERFGFSEEYFSLEITTKKVEIKSIKPIPYFGIRGLGFNLFYSF